MKDLQVISSKIKILPDRPPFLLDSDLAMIYGTKTERINEAVKRNPDRFPEDFIFQLTKNEAESCGDSNFEIAICDLKKDSRGGRRYLPHAFTQEGCNMLSAVLNTPVAIQRSIQIMRAFTAMERGENAALEVLIQMKEAFTFLSEKVKELESRPSVVIDLPDDTALPIAIERKIRKRTHCQILRNPEARQKAIGLLEEGKFYIEVTKELNKIPDFKTSKSSVGRFWKHYRLGYFKWN